MFIPTSLQYDFELPQDPDSGTPRKPLVAGALLVNPQRQLLLHHRDDKPGIASPNKWALFGGHLEDGESPRSAMIRELKEELGIVIDRAQPFCMLDGHRSRFFLFLVPIELQMERLVLGEGQGLGYFTATNALESLDLSSSARAAIEFFQVYERYRNRERERSRTASENP